MKHFWRAMSLLFLLLAVWVGVSTVRTALQADDGGPPLGACASGAPGIILLIAAGAAWEESQRPKLPESGPRNDPPDDAETANPDEPGTDTPPQRPEDEA